MSGIDLLKALPVVNRKIGGVMVPAFDGANLYKALGFSGHDPQGWFRGVARRAGLIDGVDYVVGASAGDASVNPYDIWISAKAAAKVAMLRRTQAGMDAFAHCTLAAMAGAAPSAGSAIPAEAEPAVVDIEPKVKSARRVQYHNGVVMPGSSAKWQFEKHSIRSLVLDGVPYFASGDVMQACGYTRWSNNTFRVPGETRLLKKCDLVLAGFVNLKGDGMRFATEAGAYGLIQNNDTRTGDALREHIARTAKIIRGSLDMADSKRKSTPEVAAPVRSRQSGRGVSIRPVTFKGEARVLDSNLGERLGVVHISRIRSGIRCHLAALLAMGKLPVVMKKPSLLGGRPSGHYYLNRSQAIYVATISTARDSVDVVREIVEAFDAYERASTSKAGASPACDPPSEIAPAASVPEPVDPEPMDPANSVSCDGDETLALRALTALQATVECQAHKIADMVAQIESARRKVEAFDKMAGALGISPMR